MAEEQDITESQTDAVEPSDTGDAEAIPEGLEQEFADAGLPTSKAGIPSDEEPSTPSDDARQEEYQQGAAEGQQQEADKEQSPSDKEAQSTVERLTNLQKEAARQLGYEPEEIANLTDAEIEAIERAGRRLRKKLSELGQIQQEMTQKEQPSKEGEQAVEKITFTEDDLTLDTDVGLEKLNKLAEQVHAINSSLQEIQQAASQAEDRAIIETCDKFFASLDPEVYPQFGTGTLESLDEDSPEYQARLELLKKADALAIGYEQSGEEVPSQEQLLEEALSIVAANQKVNAAKREVRKKVEQRSKQRIGRPGGRERAKKPVSEEQEGLEKLKEEFAKAGITPVEDEGPPTIVW